jgi:hypothetical protein
MSRPSNVVIATIKRNQRFRGPTSSEQQNDFQAEVIRDLTSFQQEWNNKIVPLTSKLPDGTDDSTVNAFTNGLDGQTFYVNADATAGLSSGRYYNTGKDRPNTVFEQFVNVFTYIDDQVAVLETAIASGSSGSGGLTAGQKTRIGDNIFNNAVASTPNSLDGKTQIQAGNILQLARDIYGVGSPTLNSNGDAVLTNSLREMVDALLELHGGNWDNDVSVTHGSISASDITTGTLGQHLVGPSSGSPGGVNDTYSGTPTNAVEDFNQIRRLLKEFKGTGAFSSAITPDGSWSAVTPSPDSFVDLISLIGTGTRSNNNPWGYSYADIPDLVTVLENIRDYTGQSAVGDTTPTYGAVNGFVQGDSLTVAIGALASGLNNTEVFAVSVSGLLESHTTNTSNPHNTTLTQASAAGGSINASQANITDLGNYFTSANVDDALQELGLRDTKLTASVDSLSGLLVGQISALETDLSNEIASASGFLRSDLTALIVSTSGHLQSEIDQLDSSLTADIAAIDSDIDFILTNSGFRRREYLVSGLADDGTVSLVHSGGMYPQVQVITLATIAGINHGPGSVLPVFVVAHATDHPGILIVHDSVDQITLTNKLDATLASGIVLIQW